MHKVYLYEVDVNKIDSLVTILKINMAFFPLYLWCLHPPHPESISTGTTTYFDPMQYNPQRTKSLTVNGWTTTVLFNFFGAEGRWETSFLPLTFSWNSSAWIKTWMDECCVCDVGTRQTHSSASQALGITGLHVYHNYFWSSTGQYSGV